jgi:hypothetical protein
VRHDLMILISNLPHNFNDVNHHLIQTFLLQSHILTGATWHLELRERLILVRPDVVFTAGAWLTDTITNRNIKVC